MCVCERESVCVCERESVCERQNECVSGASQRRYSDYFDTALSNSGYIKREREKERDCVCVCV